MNLFIACACSFACAVIISALIEGPAALILSIVQGFAWGIYWTTQV